MKKCDFSGWATRVDLLCSDGRIIRKDAFKNDDGKKLPLVWNHQHNDPNNVLGHAILENRDEGVYAYCTFNNTESGRNAKLLVEHGDVSALSIWANGLKQQGSNVLHGNIKEVSLVLAGANPGALIDDVIRHGEVMEEEAIIYTGEPLVLQHAEEEPDNNTKEDTTDAEKTVEEVLDSMTEEQQNVLYGLVARALKSTDEEPDDDKKEGGSETMKHNVFENEGGNENTLSHSEIASIFNDMKRYGSLKDSVLAHGIEDIDYLFPDTKNVMQTPQFIQRDMSWVEKVMNAVHKTPFSRIKSVFADITEDDARAKGYIKGKLKKEEVFTLLKRTTTPTTVYKKQKMDRDDVVDITDFDVVAWLRYEMRMMLNEEIARAALVSDGRLSSSDDKINEQNIRPIATDEDLYTIKAIVPVAKDTTAEQRAKEFIRTAIKARKDYKGSGQPTLYTTEDVLTDCLLIEDSMGRTIYEDEAKLAKKLRVKEIVTVPVMEGAKGKNGGDLMGIIVNLADYNIGADKGGAVNMFDDFDIDYNQQKYLIETRCSGALIKPYAAIALETGTAVNP